MGVACCVVHSLKVYKSKTGGSRARLWFVNVTLTVAEHSEAEEIEVALSLHRVPANVRVALRHQHHAALQPAACQILHHLHTRTH